MTDGCANAIDALVAHVDQLRAEFRDEGFVVTSR
jgi:hypothetical protein